VFQEDQGEVVTLGEESSASGTTRYNRPPPPVYSKIPGLRYIPKNHVQYKAGTVGACQEICDRRATSCNSFNYNAKLSECKISEQHLGYDPDFILEQKGFDEETKSRTWEMIPGITGFQSGYLRVADQSHVQCKHLCVKAPACAVISYRKRDGLCLLTGRSLEINENWVYYEKQGVPENSKGFVLPAGGITHKAHEIDLATLQAHIADQVSTADKEVAQEKSELMQTKHKVQKESLQAKEEVQKVDSMEKQIEELRASTQKKLDAAKKKTDLELQEGKLDLARIHEQTDEQYRRKQSRLEDKFAEDSARLAAKTKLAHTKEHVKGLMLNVKIKAEKDSYAAKIKSMHRKLRALMREKADYGKTEEEVKENFSKKMTIHNQAVIEESKHERKRLLHREKRFLEKLHARNEQGTIEVAKAAAEEKRRLEYKHQASLRAVKHATGLIMSRYQYEVRQTKMNDRHHKKLVEVLEGKISQIKDEVNDLRNELLATQGNANATKSRVRMELNATNTTLTERIQAVIDEINVAGDIQEADKERKEKQQMAMDRMHERARERQELADQAALKDVVDKQANAKRQAAQATTDAAYKKLQRVAQKAGSLPIAMGQAMMTKAENEYKNIVEEQNEKLEAIEVQHPPKIIVHNATVSTHLTFERP